MSIILAIDELRAKTIARIFFAQHHDAVIINHVKEQKDEWVITVKVGFANTKKEIKIGRQNGKIINLKNIYS